MCVVIGLAIAACVLGQAVTLAVAISRVFLGGADFHDISKLLVLLAALTVMRAALAYLQETAAARASANVKSQLRQGLMRRVIDAARRGFPTIGPERSRNWPPAGWMRSTRTSRAICHKWC